MSAPAIDRQATGCSLSRAAAPGELAKRCFLAQLEQALSGLHQGFRALGEMETDKVIYRLGKEAGAGHRGHSYLACHPFAEGNVVLPPNSEMSTRT